MYNIVLCCNYASKRRRQQGKGTQTIRAVIGPLYHRSTYISGTLLSRFILFTRTPFLNPPLKIMDELEVRLIEEVRKYDHLYNSSSKSYKDSQMSNHSWREIGLNLGVDSVECMKRWKNLRDKFVRYRRKIGSGSGDPGGKKVPVFYTFMSWLEPHVKHRDTEFMPPSPLAPASPASPAPAKPNKRKRMDLSDVPVRKHLDRLNERRQELQQRLANDSDECSRFGATVADMMRRVPEARRADLMFEILTKLHENRE
ncbi:hypothetical protein NL108_007073 [Boleophthalmus pectinirostris]|uniref:uncharacterized protein LOC129412058 n=1 Tax=Boleophthalmus pectinirostris TaxID=150288 RepID=UPI0024311ABF|nr:uncharacterized protein LOC129412058 [Boleophthalmus pectinirostris]KAJ0065341.1 hypothetical protein NL108_007073 [Boleophthalmus pectinirostris]